MAGEHYEPEWTMQRARAHYFDVNGFGADGGYGEPWVDFHLGPIPFPFPNTQARVRAVRYHDLHHVLTGYATDFRGELEIAAWEIGAGCRDFWAAWQLNLGGTAAGALLIPKRTFAAFVRGRRSRSLYGLPFEELLTSTVTETRRRMQVPDAAPPATLADRLLFATAVATGSVVALATFVLAVPLLPFAYVVFSRRARSARALAGS